ncbi:hypothetical protein CBC_A0794 [Clostridium botulinum C str. Eklund]|nr:hypothetical protein CBC_A0794 [Clostridium botulinum C str. Eklund]NEZ50254.1 hypothetical protein [Clostridium botulinum]
MKYYSKFEQIHNLLKKYSCKATYNWEEEYKEGPEVMLWSMDGCTDSFFYKPFECECIEEDFHYKKEWEEKVDAVLDVVAKSKIRQAERQEIRFDITYSQRVKKYSMYISLPTSSRSIPLSKDVYKNQDEVIHEIEKWLIYAKCKKNKIVKRKNDSSFEQLTLI